jgi:iron(II)-dependent oxidoreductase
MVEAGELRGWISDARARTLALVSDLADDQLLGPRLAIVNPLLWEIAHVAWFQDLWVLRHALGRPPARAAGDSLYDSSRIPHDTRWDLPLLPRAEAIAYLEETAARAREAQRDDAPPALAYFQMLAVFHEDMHDEAFLYTRQTLGYPPPPLDLAAPPGDAGPLPGDVEVPGGPFLLGAPPASGFVFDNEKWAHEVPLEPFAIARAPVTQAELAAFVDDAGYARRELWTAEGWAWRERAGAAWPFHWRRGAAGWERRDFDRFVPLEPHRPVIHVNAFEAEAYCRWAGRRLPTEPEWERAAEGAPIAGNLDARRRGCVDVAAFPEGDSAAGCRQMFGNVWEWTSSAFLPYPGFEADPYRDYSQPWFATHRVLRGGAWTTRARLLRRTWRNFYTPDRRDVLAGFRTCPA